MCFFFDELQGIYFCFGLASEIEDLASELKICAEAKTSSNLKKKTRSVSILNVS